MKLSRGNSFCFFLLLILILTGCSSIVDAHRQKQPLLSEYLHGQQERALQRLDNKLTEPKWYNSSVVGSGDEVMWRLEAGSLNFLLDNNSESIAHFERAEDLIEDFDSRALVNLRHLGSESAGLFTNMNALPYRGFCRDRIMLPLFKAFAYLGNGAEEAFRVELFRLRETQNKVIDDYEKYFQAEEAALAKAKAGNADAARNVDLQKVLSEGRNYELAAGLQQTRTVAHRGYGNFLNPFAIFMSAYGFARDNDFQNAIVDYQRLYQALPHNNLVQKYYVTGLQRTNRSIPAELKNVTPLDFSLGRDSLMLIFANGRSAALREIALYIPIFYPGYSTLATAAWPVCEYYPRPYQRLSVVADGQQHHTEVIADMDGILAQEYTERLPGMITRVILNAAIKELGSYFANRSVREANSLAYLGTMLGTSAYKIAFNTADTRTWEILPKEYQVVEFAMPQQREIIVSTDGLKQLKIALPTAAKSAIVYVNAPSYAPAAMTIKVFALQTK